MARGRPAMWKFVADTLLAFSAFPPIFAVLVRWWPPADFVAHFLMQTLVLSAALAVFFFCLGENRRSVLAFGISLAAFPALLPHLTVAGTAVDGDAGYRIIFANVRNNAETNQAALADWLDRRDADAVLLVEVSPRTASLLTTLVESLPYHAWCADEFLCETLILSRFPLRDVRYAVDPSSGGKVLFANLDRDGEGNLLHLALTHIAGPMRPGGVANQRDQVAFVAGEVAAAAASPLLLAGDFNATPWSGALAALRAAGLWFPVGLIGTWPRYLPGPLRLTIDHVGVTCGLNIAHRRTLAVPGSDHAAVEVRVQRNADVPCW